MTHVDMVYRSRNPALWARIIWQHLFDYYRKNGGSLTDMDSLLCDLRIIESKISRDEQPFYWSFYPDSSYTQITMFDLGLRYQLKVVIGLASIDILET